MGDEATRARAMLAAWREQGVDRRDRLRFDFIEALASRSDAHDGEARRLLDARLSGLVDACAGAVDRMPAHATGMGDAGMACPSTPSALGELLDHIGGGPAAPAHRSSAYPELPELDGFRRLWTRVRTDSQLRQALEQTPTDAGPLNSGVLVHRAIALMRTLSPGYLQHFIAYVDTLSSLQRMREDNASMGAGSPRGEPARKPARARTRRRSG